MHFDKDSPHHHFCRVNSPCNAIIDTYIQYWIHIFKTTFQKCCFINKVANYITAHTISDLMFEYLSTTILRQQNERARPAIKGCFMIMQLTTIHHFTIENNNNIINIIITFWLWLVTKLLILLQDTTKKVWHVLISKRKYCVKNVKKTKQKSFIKNTILHAKNNNYYFIKIIVKLACFPWHLHSLCIMANCCHWLANSLIKCKVDFLWHQLTMHAIFPV